jgi:beta-lactamase superfamily II metal-dependent hydrolase
MFQLEAVQAKDGDCFLLHYDSGGKLGLILIDGGSAGVYSDSLKPRLQQLRGKTPMLDLRMVIVSHIDADHITGVLDLFRQMGKLQDDGQSLPYKIGTLWHNAFGKLVKSHTAGAESAAVSAAVGGEVAVLRELDEDVAAVVASVKQGDELRKYATQITTINKEASGDLIFAPEGQKREYKIADSLRFTILGPQETELNNLDREWNKSKSKKSQGASEQSVSADYLNRTVPNLSSIVILATKTEGNGQTRRMLLTGDAGGDLILEALERQQLLDANRKIKVDLLKVQHHGSNHSVDEDFFRRVLADTYVISGNGKHGIPHHDALCWLSNARHCEDIDVYMTNRTGFEGLTNMLDEFLSEEARKEPKHKYHFRNEGDYSITAVVS